MKKITFSSPFPQTKYVETSENTLTAVILHRAIVTDPATLTSSITVQVGLFNAGGNLVKIVGPFEREWPAAWDTRLDNLDSAVLAALKGTEIPDGTVG